MPRSNSINNTVEDVRLTLGEIIYIVSIKLIFIWGHIKIMNVLKGPIVGESTGKTTD